MKEVKLQKYSAYKDSGVEWLGEIPEHWEVKKITHIFNTIGSGTTPTAGTAKYYDDGIINFLQTGDLTDGLIRATSKRITTKAISDFSSLKIYPKESLVVAMYGATIGKVGYLDIESTTNQACCVLGVPNDFFIKYGFYWFIGAKSTIISMSYGGGQPNISQDLIKSLRVSVPPIEEQTAIANFLDNKTALIDKAIALKEKQIELLKERRQILIHRAVTRGLNPNVKLKDSGVEWIGEIPEHWEVKKLKYTVDSNPNHDKNKKLLGKEVSFMPMECLRCGKIEERAILYENALSYVPFQNNDIVMAKVTPCFENNNIAIANNLINNIGFGTSEIFVFRCYDIVDKQFLFYFLQTEYIKMIGIRSMTGTAGLKRVNINTLLNSIIILPTKNEQLSIAEFIGSSNQKISTAITLKEKEIEKLKEYKSVLINEAVSGKIKVG